MPKRGRQHSADHPTAPKVPPGTQPDRDGKLLCLVCGKWFRQLGQHVVTKHHIPADDYRQRFGLPQGRGLHSAQVAALRSERGRAIWRDDPTMRQRLRPVHTTADERRTRSTTMRRATASRPGVQAALAGNGAAANRAWIAAKDAEFDAAAVAAGFTSLAAMLAATDGLPAREVAELLGTDAKRVGRMRRRHGYVSVGGGRPPGVGVGESRQCLECGRWYRGLGQHITMAHHLTMADYRTRHPVTAGELARTSSTRVRPAQTLPLTRDELIQIPRGTQPADGDGRRLVCLICGQWFRGLSQHLVSKHHVNHADYRERYGLAPDQALSRAARLVVPGTRPA